MAKDRRVDRHAGHLIVVRVPLEMRAELLRIGKRVDRPVSWLARKAFTEFIAADKAGDEDDG